VITRSEFEAAHKRVKEILSKAGVVVHNDEIEQMEIVDFSLSELDLSGAQIITLVDTESIAVKLLVLFPNQTEPEHKHPPLGDYIGKEEIIRCEWGELYLYGLGEATPNPKGHPPDHRKNTYTVWHEHILHPGEQVVFPPNTLHWFQAGPEGVIIWSFSTKVVDVQDIFTDPEIKRKTEIVDD
jgi:D-lyxose ketol-isomerase